MEISRLYIDTSDYWMESQYISSDGISKIIDGD